MPNWLASALETQRRLSPRLNQILRVDRLTSDDFLDFYYTQNRPVILTNAISDWLAINRWTPNFLMEVVGDRQVHLRQVMTADPHSGQRRLSAAHPAFFSEVVRQLEKPTGSGSRFQLNADENQGAFSALKRDVGSISGILDFEAQSFDWAISLGSKLSKTSLGFDRSNVLSAQLLGHRDIKLVPPTEFSRLQNDLGEFTGIDDLESTNVDLTLYPRLKNCTVYEITLAPGEVLFVPLGWWSQDRAPEISISLAFKSFAWKNTF